MLHLSKRQVERQAPGIAYKNYCSPLCISLLWAILTFFFGCNSGEPKSVNNGAITQAVSQTKELPPLFVDDVSELQYDFPVKNETGRPIQFTKLIQGCACMGASRIDAMSLAPGEETLLHFHVDLRQRKGRQRIVCRLLEASGSEWSYAIEAILYKRAAFAENGTLHFGMVDPKREEVREVALFLRAENADSLPRQVSFRTNSTHLQVEAGEPTTEALPDQIVERKSLSNSICTRPKSRG